MDVRPPSGGVPSFVPRVARGGRLPTLREMIRADERLVVLPRPGVRARSRPRPNLWAVNFHRRGDVFEVAHTLNGVAVERMR
jgi:hypothetical protein